ncbi:acetyl-coenzyme-A carboxylase, partial [Coemansia spiralis]
AGAEFPARALLATVSGFLLELAPAQTVTLTATMEPLMRVLEAHRDGAAAHERDVFVSLLQRYADTEEIFSQCSNEEEAFFALREKHRAQPELIVEAMVSHAGAVTKNKVVLALLDAVHPTHAANGPLDAKYEAVLKRVAELSGRTTAKVALKAREVLLQCQVPSLEERQRQMEQMLRASVTETVYGCGEEFRTPSYDAICDLVVTNYYVYDVLQSFLQHPNPYIQLAALEVYVRRAYHMYNLFDFDYLTEPGAPFMVHWRFVLQDDSSGMFVGRIGGGQSVSDLKRIMSVSDLNFAVDKDADPTQYLRQGAMAAFDTFEAMEAGFERLLSLVTPNGTETSSRAESPALGMRPLGRFAPMSSLNGDSAARRSSDSPASAGGRGPRM